MASGFGLEDTVPFQMPPKTHLVHAVYGLVKIVGSGSPVVCRYQFTMVVVSGENFPPFRRHIKIGEMEMDGATICRTVA